MSEGHREVSSVPLERPGTRRSSGLERVHRPPGAGRGFERRPRLSPGDRGRGGGGTGPRGDGSGRGGGPPSRGARPGSPGHRVRLMQVVVAVAFAALVIRLVEFQLTSAPTYRTLGAQETVVTQTVPALRGPIYDREGGVLAMSQPVDVVVADPRIIDHPRSEAGALAPLLGISSTTLDTELSNRSTGYVVLDRTLASGTGTKVANLGLRGITLTPSSQRIEVDGSLAAPLLGSVDAAGVGASGIEYQYQKVLAGHPGSTVQAVSPSGVVLPGTAHSTAVARAGTGVELTISQPLQYETEQALAAGVAKAHATNGIAVVMDPRTGDILAMASMVRDAATGAVTEAPQNLAVTQVYEPGSAFKLVTFSAALQDGIITPDTVVEVPSVLPIDGALFHDAWAHPAEPMTASQILAESSNMGTILIAEKLGAARLAAQIHRLGFGQPTGLGFPGASAGLVKPVSQWSPTAIGSTPIGQDTGVTAQQLLDMFATVANGGVAVPPRLVAATISPGGTVHRVPRARGRRLIAAGADAELVKMMESVATPIGTAPAAAVPGYLVAGKTGTSQIPDPATGGYTPGAFWGTFAGFAPAQDPALAAVVVMTHPQPIYGGSVSAPVFSTIMQYALHHYAVPAAPGSASQPLPPTPAQVGAAPTIGVG